VWQGVPVELRTVACVVAGMSERQIEIIEVVAVLVFIAVVLWWGNSVGIERMTP